jgi:hypothetical protein
MDPEETPRPVTDGPSWGSLLAFGLATRVAVVLLGAWLARPDTPALSLGRMKGVDRSVAAANRDLYRRHMGALFAERPWWVASWYRWDAVWYAEVSQYGYTFEPGRHCSAGFMPLLPMIMAAGAALGLDRYAVGLLAANAAFVLGLACFGRVAWRATGDTTAAWRACVLLTAYPYSLFFSAPYHESLYLALTAAAVLAWRAGRPVPAAACIAVASAARLTAPAFGAAVLAEWAWDLDRGRPARHAAWLVAAASGLGAALFFLDLGARLGDPFAHLKAHAAWARERSSVGNVVLCLTEVPSGLGPESNVTGFAAMILFLALGVLAWHRRGPFWGCLILLPVLQALSTGTTLSLPRIVLTAYPAFIDLALTLRRPSASWGCAAASTLIQISYIESYVNLDFLG